ncbi:MAG: homoserine kinase [Paenibacillus sp.]|nr:homoserine kinase [Paenibacillus sp.]
MDQQELDRQEVMQALDAYGIRPDEPIAALTGGTANRNYVIRSSGQVRILRRRSAKYSGDDWIDYEEQYLLHMGEKGIPVPVPLPTAQGSRRCTVGKGTYQLFPYMDGESYDPYDPEQLAAAGAFLGTVHRAAEDFCTECVKSLPRYDNPAVISEALNKVLHERRDMSHPERRTLDSMLVCSERVRERLSDEVYRGLPHTVIHGDYHPANVAYRNGRICALYDFDWISLQPRVRDIADLIVYFAALRPEPLDGGSIYSLIQGCTFDMDRAAVALQAYVRTFGTPLTAGEIAALPDFMAARLLHSRVQALAKVPPERAIEVLVGAIEPALIWIEQHRNALADRIV